MLAVDGVRVCRERDRGRERECFVCRSWGLAKIKRQSFLVSTLHVGLMHDCGLAGVFVLRELFHNSIYSAFIHVCMRISVCVSPGHYYSGFKTSTVHQFSITPCYLEGLELGLSQLTLEERRSTPWTNVQSITGLFSCLRPGCLYPSTTCLQLHQSPAKMFNGLVWTCCAQSSQPKYT